MQDTSVEHRVHPEFAPCFQRIPLQAGVTTHRAHRADHQAAGGAEAGDERIGHAQFQYRLTLPGDQGQEWQHGQRTSGRHHGPRGRIRFTREQWQREHGAKNECGQHENQRPGANPNGPGVSGAGRPGLLRDFGIQDIAALGHGGDQVPITVIATGAQQLLA